MNNRHYSVSYLFLPFYKSSFLLFPLKEWKLLNICNCIAAAAKSLQSCPTLCDPIDSSPPGSPVPGILQARTLERVAISFFNAWTWKVKVKLLSRVRLLVTPGTTAYQAPPSMGFSRQEYWSGGPSPSPLRTNSRDKVTAASTAGRQLPTGQGELTVFAG